MRALKHTWGNVSGIDREVTTQAHEGIETPSNVV